MVKRYYASAMATALLLLLLSMLLSLMLGAVSFSMKDTVNALLGQVPRAELLHTIIWQIRLPRLLSAVLVGAGLAICGAILQNASRNPLADPYLFGLMAGAGLGATLVSVVLPPQLVSMALGAFAGALFAVALVFAVCAGQHWRKVEITLLAGVAVSFMLSAISS
ncbi:MAG TPA: iron chelate uptake ABC transporter family permease subunit, partial [Rheinheimera sp.]|nr:iron chelate uptake ABC transporter family permease subunit [Rheinheimera sp.]